MPGKGRPESKRHFSRLDKDGIKMSERQGEFGPFARRMRAENLPEIVIRSFHHYYRQLAAGSTGLIAESDIEPVCSLPDVEEFPPELAKRGEQALSRTVLVKLNGGLGTSMGLEGPKSLLRARGDLTFLDIIARQAIEAEVPLLLMNSFNTRQETLRALAAYDELNRQEVPLDFLQHKVPKVAKDDLRPARWPQDPELEWCPPGHGDLYTALVTSGTLDVLLERGYRYALVANADNLGAVLDTAILGYFVERRFPFMMEVADRTEADRKGGHLARSSDGRLILRESAQCPPQDRDAFQDTERYRYFNTNNLWLDLEALGEVMCEKDNLLGLPMIRNEKRVDPRDSDSMPVYQLETAMGSAISVFEGAGAVRVPRTRFSPVKTTNDLLAVRSDAYVLTRDYQVRMKSVRGGRELVVDLDPDYYRLVDEMESRFPFGPPSLVDCQKFKIRGDIRFGRQVVVRGSVQLRHSGPGQFYVEDDSILTSDAANATQRVDR